MNYYILSLVFLFSSVAFSEAVFNWGINDDLFYFNKNALEFKKNIEEKLKGKVKINIITYKEEEGKGNNNGNSIENYQIYQTLVGNFFKEVPEFKIWSMPFLFVSNEQVEKYIESDNAKRTLAKLETKDLKPVDYAFSGGFFFIHGPIMINSFSDLANKKINLETSFNFGPDFLKSLNIQYGEGDFVITSDKISEVLASSSLEIAAERKVKEVIVTGTNHRVQTRVLYVSKKQLNLLSKKDQKIFLTLLKNTLRKERADSVEGGILSLKALKNRGFKVSFWTADKIRNERALFAKNYKKFHELLGKEISYIDSLDVSGKRKISSKTK